MILNVVSHTLILSVAYWHLCNTNILNISETLKHAHGNYTSKTIQRAGKMVGPLGKTLDNLFHVKIAGTEMDDGYTKKRDFQVEVESFCADYKEDRLFDKVPGRCHPSFPEYQCDLVIQDPELFKARLQKYAKKLDRSRPNF